MGDTSSFISKAHLFNGQNYAAWKVKMKAYLQAYDLWDAVEKGDEIDPLPEHPIATQEESC